MCSLLLLLSSAACSAQNVTGYGGMTEPLLFLLREPAVVKDLALTATQRAKLTELNDAYDGMLLASRNMKPQEGQAKINEALTGTRSKIPDILTPAQLRRIQEIKYRLQGISCVLLPQAVKQLQLTESQTQKIEQIVEQTREVVKENTSQTFEGKEAYQKAQQAISAAKQAEQKQILGALSDQQRQRLSALVGRSFDPKQLGRVSFKAPELSQGDQWLNSKPLQLQDLRGKVIALHFYAFG